MTKQPHLDVGAILKSGELTILGQIRAASNVSFLCDATLFDTTIRCIYKPVRGERPLWDFPDGTLASREYASYLIAEECGWHLVPTTVLRDGPVGTGMLQEWIETTDREFVGVFPLGEVPPGFRGVLRAQSDDDPPQELEVAHSTDPSVRTTALLDVVLNNADRKGGHLLCGDSGQVYAIDHGICLHSENKLRTVLWGWAGEQLTAEELDTLEKLSKAFAGSFGDTLREHITGTELSALRARTERVLAEGHFPYPAVPNPIPWPLW
ncbi:SCO1664 family protein [Hoyosella rhizosphaerae]|nr:SCO1664 family protein [Hoyosella rhizosphaerae]